MAAVGHEVRVAQDVLQQVGHRIINTNGTTSNGDTHDVESQTQGLEVDVLQDVVKEVAVRQGGRRRKWTGLLPIVNFIWMKEVQGHGAHVAGHGDAMI